MNVDLTRWHTYILFIIYSTQYFLKLWIELYVIQLLVAIKSYILKKSNHVKKKKKKFFLKNLTNICSRRYPNKQLHSQAPSQTTPVTDTFTNICSHRHHHKVSGRVCKGVGHLDHIWSYGVRKVVSSIPDRGNNYSRMSFSSDQVTGTVFPHLKMIFLPNSEFI